LLGPRAPNSGRLALGAIENSTREVRRVKEFTILFAARNRNFVRLASPVGRDYLKKLTF
jgi:hypothetical protein